MGCWGITAFESDAGLDAVGFIRDRLPKDGKVKLEDIMEALKQDEWNAPPDVTNGQSHTSLMALAEIMVHVFDQDTGSFGYEEEWAAEGYKFSALTSFTASKEFVQWLRDYVSDTLQHAREKAASSVRQSGKWGGWFEEQDWIDWQGHMEKLTVRLDELLASPENRIELVPLQEQKNGPAMNMG